MSDRLKAAGLALLLLVVVFGLAWREPVGYVLLEPGPTVDVLGKTGSGPSVVVEGHPTYPDKGQLRLVTVEESSFDDHISLARALLAWIVPAVDAYPRSLIYPDTSDSTKQQGALEMSSSQESATAAALHQMQIPFQRAVKVLVVDDAGPAAKVIKTGDLLVSVNGTPTTQPQDAVKLVRALKPGSAATVVVLRDGQQLSFPLVTQQLGASGESAGQSRIGVSLGPSFEFPFKVSLKIPDNIGGPSAGLMFALSIYDVLNPGGITGGHVIAGTGTIDSEGKVGEIGGIRQKIAGAARDNAQLFFVPAGNCDEARLADYDHGAMRLVKVSTMADALAALKTWTVDPKAALPGCS